MLQEIISGSGGFGSIVLLAVPVSADNVERSVGGQCGACYGQQHPPFPAPCLLDFALRFSPPVRLYFVVLELFARPSGVVVRVPTLMLMVFVIPFWSILKNSGPTLMIFYNLTNRDRSLE